MKKILGLLPKIGMGILVVMMLGITGFMAYIMFAPDTWPKPFHLQYSYSDTPAATEEAAASSEGHSTTSSETTTSAEPKEEAPKAMMEISPGQGLMFETGTKIVNLVDPTGRKYLRVGIVLEFAPTEIAYFTMEGEEKVLFVETFNEEMAGKLPVINDVIISLLASQTFESVYTAEGKEELRKQIMDKINTQLPEFQVIFVYFTEFVVQ